MCDDCFQESRNIDKDSGMERGGHRASVAASPFLVWLAWLRRRDIAWAEHLVDLLVVQMSTLVLRNVVRLSLSKSQF